MANFEEQYKRLFGEELKYDPISSPADESERPTPRLDTSHFGKQYKRLFGEDITYEPISTGRPSGGGISGLLDTDLGGAGGAPARQPIDPDWLRGRTGPQEDTGIIEEVGRTLGAGTVGVGGMLLGGLEYAARQAEDAVPTGVGNEVLGDIRESLTEARQATQEFSQDILAGMDQEAQDSMQRHFLSLDPTNSVWRGGFGDTIQSIGLKFSQALPATVAMLLPAAVYFRAGMTPAALTYMGASEGGLSLGGIANGVSEEVEAMTHEQLVTDSVFYRGLIDQGVGEADARTQLIAQAQGAAPLIGGIMVGAISATVGRLLVPVFAPKTPGAGMAIGKRFGVGFGEEALQETPQSGVEQAVQNISAAVFDADRGITEGVTEAMAEGLVIGGLAGGGFTSVLGTRPQPLAPPLEGEVGGPDIVPPPVAPDEGPGGQLEMFPGAEIPPLEKTDFDPDLTAPPGVGIDPRQADLLDPAVEGVAVSAEPVRDIHAQLDELQRPESDREAVYLSPDNLANLEELGQLDAVLERGVAIANFDRAGGTLIARDRTTAESLLDLREEAFASGSLSDISAQMDQVIGLATTAGTGKPDFLSGEGELVVQRRDETGAVVQESSVAGVEEAESLTIAWQRQNPNSEVITLPAAQSIQRREMLLDEERRPLERAAALDARADELEAARLIGQAATEQAIPERQRIGGFYPPSAMEFRDEREGVRYANRWRELVDIEIQVEQGTAPTPVRQRRDELLDELAEIRRRAKPRLKSARLIREAKVVSPRTVKAAEKETRRRATKKPEGLPAAPAREVDEDMLRALTDTQIDNLSGDKLKVAFSQAANYLAGRYRALELFYTGATDPTGMPTDIDELDYGETKIPTPDTIPEGAELLAAHIPEERQLKPMLELGELKRGPGPNGLKGIWVHYEIKQGDEVTKGTRRGTIKDARAALEEDIRKRNAQIAKANVTGLKGITLDELLDKNKTAATQRALIRRVKNQLIGRQYGGKVMGKPVAKTAVKKGPKKGVYRRKGKFDTRVLTQERLPKDESRKDRRLRENAARKIRTKLDKTLRKSAGFAETLTRGRFAKLAAERDEHGELTDTARSLIHGKTYFRYIVQFATALHNSKNKSLAAIAEMQAVDKFLFDATRMQAEDFGRTFGNLMKAETQEQLRELRGFDAIREKLADPEQREAMNAEINSALMGAQAALYRMETHYKTNPYYNSIVAPLIHKFTASAFRDGYPSYNPTLEELEKLQWVMDNWKIPRLRKIMYTPIRRFLTQVGMQWTKDGTLIIPLDPKTKEYSWSAGGPALLPRYTAKFGQEAETITPAEQVMQPYNEIEKIEGEGAPKYKIARKLGRQWRPGILVSEISAYQQRGEGRDWIEKRADRAAEVAEFSTRMQANRVIEKTRKIVANPRTTIAGLIRAEERFIAAMKELGMWADVSPRFGRISQRIPRRYHMIGNRLQNKEMQREDARKLMLKGLRQEPIPKELAADPILVGRAATDEQPALRGRANEPVSAGDALFLEITNPGPADVEKFTDLATSIILTLDDTSRPTKMNDLLERVVQALPSDHVYHDLAQKLLDLNMDDVPVSWDHRGQIEKPDVLATAKWELQSWNPRDGETQLRYILMARNTLRNSPDPTLSTIHALLHESVHMATQGALEKNPHIRQAIRSIRHVARQEWLRRNPGKRGEKDMPYALRHPNEAEFMAETFSNIQTQNFLKTVQIENTTLWNRILRVIRDILGPVKWLQRAPALNALDAMMSLQHPLFTNEARVIMKKDVETAMVEMDPVMRPTGRQFLEPMVGNMDTLRKGWEFVKGKINAPLSLMTMRQIHSTFRSYFAPGGIGEGALDKYKSFWEKRDAENSKLKKQGDDILRPWVELTEKEGVGKNKEFSRIATEATLGVGVDPSVPLSHPNNAHVTSAEAKAKHAQLEIRYNALSDGYKKLWGTVRRYYDTALKEEINLVMMNALRGTLTGKAGVMDTAEFDALYTEETIGEKKLTTTKGLQAEFGEQLSEAQISTLLQIARIPEMRKGPYFPLMRYGDYVVYAQREAGRKTFTERKDATAYAKTQLDSDPTLDVSIKTEENGTHTVVTIEKDFRTFENRTEAEQAEQDMVQQYGRDGTTNVQLKDKFEFSSVAPQHSGLASILRALEGNPGAQNAIKDWWLSNLRDSSFRKLEIRRKNRAGVDYELQQRNFANYITKSAYYRAHLKYGWRMAEAMGELKDFVRDYKQVNPGDPTNERLGQIRNHLINMESKVTDVREVNKWAKRGTEVGQVYLLVGPSFWLINASQPWLVSLPWMAARHGWKATTAAMKTAQKLIATPMYEAGRDSRGGFTLSKTKLESAFNVLDQVKQSIREKAGPRADQYIEMLESLREHNVMDLSWIAELRDISEGIDTTLKQKVLDGSRVMAHLTEVNNRIFTGIAAYDLRYEEILAREGGTHELAHKEGIAFAEEAVAETHFDYSAGNKPLLFQPKGPLRSFAPLVFQFMQYPQHIYAMMVSNMVSAVGRGHIDKKVARDTLLGVLGMNVAFAGIGGVMLQPLKWMFGLTMLAFGDDDDTTTIANAMSGERFDRAMRAVAADLLGPKLGQAVSRGIPAAMGLDLSDRLSFGTIYFLNLRTDTAQSTIGSVVTGLGGPWLTIGSNMSRGVGKIGDGQFLRGIEMMSPKIIRDILRMTRYAREGVVNNAGDTMLDADGLNPLQLFFQSIGFSPSEISEMYARQSLIKDIERFGTDRRSSLLRHYRTADSIEDRQAIMREMREFNKVFPHARITRSSIVRALHGKREREQAHLRYGANIRGRARILGQEGEHYR